MKLLGVLCYVLVFAGPEKIQNRKVEHRTKKVMTKSVCSPMPSKEILRVINSRYILYTWWWGTKPKLSSTSTNGQVLLYSQYMSTAVPSVV
jgi:hypothetical protein